MVSIASIRRKKLVKMDLASVQYVHFLKNLYDEVPEIAKMTKEEVDAYRRIKPKSRSKSWSPDRRRSPSKAKRKSRFRDKWRSRAREEKCRSSRRSEFISSGGRDGNDLQIIYKYKITQIRKRKTMLCVTQVINTFFFHVLIKVFVCFLCVETQDSFKGEGVNS